MSFLPKLSDSVRQEILTLVFAIPLSVLGTAGLFFILNSGNSI